MRTQQISLVFAAVVLAVGVAGCTSQGGGQPGGTSTAASDAGSQESTPSSASSDGAPQVKNPKDASKPEPCALLNASQVGALGFSSDGKKEDLPGGQQGCAWKSTDGISASLAVSKQTSGSGIGTVYSNKSTFDVFESSVIDGYPAVHAEEPGIDPAKTCDLSVGIADSQQITVIVQNLEGHSIAQPCDAAKKAAQSVLSNLPAGR